MAKWGEINCPRCAELETENATLKQVWWDAGDVTDLAGTIADLEGKLAKAVEAMQFWSEAVEPDVDKAITLMASTLAELKGQGDA